MRRVEVLSPFSGRVVPLEEVPDPVFAQKIMGDGLAVDPTEGVTVAPVTGKLAVFHSAGHAFAIQANETKGLTVLVHVGINTVKMEGEGFTRLADAGDEAKAGQELVHFDRDVITTAGYSPISPVILTDLPPDCKVEKTSADTVRAGHDVLLVVNWPG